MQHPQLNFALAFVAVVATAPSLTGTIAKPHKPDPLLDGGPTADCAAGPNYAAGSDVNGNVVAPPDIGGGRIPVPEGVGVPLHGGQQSAQPGRGFRPGMMAPAGGEGPYVMLDGRRLEPLVNPQPCR